MRKEPTKYRVAGRLFGGRAWYSEVTTNVRHAFHVMDKARDTARAQDKFWVERMVNNRWEKFSD